MGRLRQGASDHPRGRPPPLRANVAYALNTFKRDYVNGAEPQDAEAVLAQLSGWIEDYNNRAPHSALGMRSPAEYRVNATLSPRGEQPFGEHSKSGS